jgi:hypothetical protein
MADREALRQILLSKGFRRTLLVVLLAIGTWFMVTALQQGSVADRCAEALATAVATKDRAYFAQHVKSPSLETRLLEAPHAELAFVRPVDSEWSRIGFLLKSSATATAAKPLFILLSHDQSKQECSFIQDYGAL